MSKHRLFSCIDEPMVKIMLDMSKEHHTPAETEEIKKKFSSVDKDKFLQLWRNMSYKELSEIMPWNLVWKSEMTGRTGLRQSGSIWNF